MKTSHTVILDDVRSAIKTVQDRAVQLIVTSPPYWNLKDYDSKGQIGRGQSYEDYICTLEEIWRQCKRVLSPGCKLVINVGDQFLRAKDNDGRYEIIPIHTDIIRSCAKLGFIFLGNIIWQKITTTKTSGGCTWMGSIYYPRDGYITYEHEYIMIFKKCGSPPRPTSEMKELSRLPKEFRSKWFRGIWDDVPPLRQSGHVAMFPFELPMRIIRMFSFAEETVLDPFVGSGTTMEAALQWNRNSIGIEINPDFLPMISSRVADVVVCKPEMTQRKAS